MPFVARVPTSQLTIDPPPRVRTVHEPSADPGMPRSINDAEAKPAAKRVKQAPREKIQPAGDHSEGYCRAPVRTRFQKGNPGGPGRPKKDSKSQDELMRAELLKSQQVTEGGRRRRKTWRELIPGLLVKATFQKLSPKELRILHDEARRLFPERTADAASMVSIDPVVEQRYVRDMIAAIQIGEASGDGVDPLAEFVTSVFDADDEEDDAPPADGDQDASEEERNDEAA